MLPEVQPPTTGFILQLFIIPGLIVLALVIGWLMVRWVVESGSDPRQHFAEIKKGRSNSWQQAVDLAQTLQANPESKNDSELAKSIADHLDALLEQSLAADTEAAGPSADQRAAGARLRQFLCIALVNFKDTSVTLPVLLKAADIDHNGDENDVKVRVAALQAIATLADRAKADNSESSGPLNDGAVFATLIAASEEDESVLRNQSAIALGVLGTDQAVERLEEMAVEAQPANVHYNIATALARNGRESAIELLLEMLQPDKIRALPEAPRRDEERPFTPAEKEQQRLFEQAHVVNTALQAVSKLAEKNKTADLTSLIAVLKKLPDSDLPEQVKIAAEQVLRDLNALATD